MKERTGERVDPRTKRTRQLLFEAFGKLLAEKTFETITVQDITERATVNRATFYAHFEDKYVLLDQFTTEMIQQTLYNKVPRNATFSAENMGLLLQAVCDFLAVLRDHCAPSNRNQFDSLVEQQVKQQLYDILCHWLTAAAGGKRGDARQLELQATVTSWAMFGAAMRWSSGERKTPPQDFVRQALPMLMAGLEAPGKTPARGNPNSKN